MGFRFRRRVRLARGVHLNLSKGRPSLSVGPRGARITLGGRGGVRQTVGLPGTGLSYTRRRRRRGFRPYRNPVRSVLGCVGMLVVLAVVAVLIGLLLLVMVIAG